MKEGLTFSGRYMLKGISKLPIVVSNFDYVKSNTSIVILPTIVSDPKYSVFLVMPTPLCSWNLTISSPTSDTVRLLARNYCVCDTYIVPDMTWPAW